MSEMLTEDEGYAFVGRFLSRFAALERALDDALARLLDLNDAAKLIVSDNMAFVGKINALRCVILENFSGDKGQIDPKDPRFDVLKRAMLLNDQRVVVAHKPFDIAEDYVCFYNFKAKGKAFKRVEMKFHRPHLADKLASMESLTAELGTMVAGLKPYRASLDFSDSRNSAYFALI